jgi:hypothetical protein
VSADMHDTFQRAAALIEEIEGYHFQYEGGPLSHCRPWLELRRVISDGVGKKAADLRDDPPPLSR